MTTATITLTLTLLLFCFITPTMSFPPSPPIQCNSTICLLSNAYGIFNTRNPCPVPSVLYPTSEQELLAAVAMATKSNLKIKLVSSFSHTIPKFSCPPPTSNALLISTSKYNTNIEINPSQRTVTADAGVGLRALIDRVEAAGMSLVAAPYWEGVSIGGLVSTGSHGSSWWGNGGAVHDHVVEMRLVVPAGRSEGYAKVVTVVAGDPLFDAARVSLGMIAAISKVTLSLEPRFKRSLTFSFQNDSSFEGDFMELARKHEFGDITWFPSQKQAIYRIDDRVPLSTPGEGVNDFIGFQSTATLASTAVRASEKAAEKAKSIKGKCTLARMELSAKKLVGFGLKNNKIIFTGYPVVGYQGNMQTSGSCLYSSSLDLLSSCAWDPRNKGLVFYETTAIFSPQKFGDFIQDVKKLRDLNPDNFCGTDNYNGMLIRFVKRSMAYLGQPEDSVVVDFNYFRADDAMTPRLSEDVWEEVEQMAFFKHGARPHWAKNRKVAFLGVQEKYPYMSSFIAARKKIDPLGVFYSPWSEEILQGHEINKDDGCALEGQCVCSEDRHCSPSNGYFCKPGLVYQEARVCRYMSTALE
ncbi:putative oxidoreductase [Dioscorea sansibarensis]